MHGGNDVYRNRRFVYRFVYLSRRLALIHGLAGGFLAKRRIGRWNYYINVALHAILTGNAPAPVPSAPAAPAPTA